MSNTRTSARKTAATDPDAEAAARVLRQFRMVFNAVRTHFQQVEKRAGIGGAHVWALSIVRERPDIGVGDLARAMDIHQSTASNLVRSLVEKGLLQVDRSASDKRAVRLRVLPAAAKVLRKAPSPFAGVLPEALAHLDARTLRRLERDLGAVIGQLQAVNERDGRKPLADL